MVWYVGILEYHQDLITFIYFYSLHYCKLRIEASATCTACLVAQAHDWHLHNNVGEDRTKGKNEQRGMRIRTSFKIAQFLVHSFLYQVQHLPASRSNESMTSIAFRKHAWYWRSISHFISFCFILVSLVRFSIFIRSAIELVHKHCTVNCSVLDAALCELASTSTLSELSMDNSPWVISCSADGME